MRPTWPAVSWLLALLLLTAAFPVHQHGQVPAASAFQTSTVSGDTQAQAPCAACRLLQTSALLPAPSAPTGVQLDDVGIPGEPCSPIRSNDLRSPAAPRAPPVLI